ncbi:alpha/beta hydrolase [Denitratisoma sp. agr-D3]
MIPTLIVPGLGGSGPDHWQSWWQALEPEAVRVEQEAWDQPELSRWSQQVSHTLEQQSRPVWIVAHSFGVLASAHAAARLPHKVAGAFWVAPADPEKFGLSAQVPDEALPFPSLLVASSNDPWLKLMNAGYLAARWGSHLVNLGEVGHINPASGFGPWIEGRNLFLRFVRSHEGIFSGEIPIRDGASLPQAPSPYQFL